MHKFLIAMGLALGVAGTASASPAPVHVKDASTVDQRGVRTLEFTTVVAARPHAVWQSLTNAETYKKWAAPVAFFDFRVGGQVEVGYDPSAKAGDPRNVKQEVTSYLPERMIAFHNI